MPAQPDFCPDPDRTGSPQGGGDKTSGAGSSTCLATEAGIAFPAGLCRRAGISFADAEAVACRGGGDDGDDDWALDAYRQCRDRQVAALKPWVDDLALWIEPGLLTSARRGGMEHLILPLCDPADGAVTRLVKLTKGEAFGFTPTCDDASSSPDDWFPPRPATPSQYLRRMALLDDLRPEIETCVEGFALVNGTLRVVTSQRFIEPVAASARSIQAFFSERGFEPVNESAWYHAGHQLALFDVTPPNVLQYDGQLYPVDIMPITPGPRMTALIIRAMASRKSKSVAAIANPTRRRRGDGIGPRHDVEIDAVD